MPADIMTEPSLWVSWPSSAKVGIAWLVDKTLSDHLRDLKIDAMDENREIRDWPDDVRVKVTEGEICDYQPSNLAIRLCSLRMREVLDRERGKDDVLHWLPVTVLDRHDQEHPYFVLDLPRAVAADDPGEHRVWVPPTREMTLFKIAKDMAPKLVAIGCPRGIFSKDGGSS